jgi:HSP20 family protein
MYLVPMSPASDLVRSFDRLFDDSFDRFFAPASRGAGNGLRSPALDVAESERGYTVKLEMPGVAKDDVKISIDGRRVSVEAQTRKEEEKREGDRVVYRERSAASYARSFTLAADIDQAESSAKLDQGVLTLTLAKRGAPVASQLRIS